MKVLGFKCSKVNVFFEKKKKAMLSFLCSKFQSIDKSKSCQMKYLHSIMNIGIFGINYVIKLLYLPFCCYFSFVRVPLAM